MRFLSKTRLKAKEIFADSFEYLSAKYEQSRNIFTPASPFGQLLSVVANLGEMVFFYIETVAAENNFGTAKNAESKYGLSRLTGHDATRGMSAFGKIQIRLKSGAENAFPGDYVQINNRTKLKSVNNNLPYFIQLESDFMRVEKNSSDLLNMIIIQGEVETQTFVSNGAGLQSFSVLIDEATDHNRVVVKVNGENYEVVESMYDIDSEAKACLVKTGISGGIDVYFGTGSFGLIPPQGALIEVEYVKTRGSAGNISSNIDVVYEFQEEGADSNGEEVDLNEVMLIRSLDPPTLGSFPEDPNFTSIIAPLASRAFVLAHPDNYVYFLRRYSFFSHIDAYNTFNDEYLDDDNVIYLFLLPDVTKKMTTNTDYFTIDQAEFVLTDVEKQMIRQVIAESGRQLTGTELQFVTPIVRKYSLNIVLSFFDNFDKKVIKEQVRTKLSEYFLQVKRRDRIPRSDLVALIETIKGIDSVTVFFNSERNEEAIREGFYYQNVYGYDPNKRRRELIDRKKITVEAGTDPGLGLNEFGDIIIGKEELPIIRGGWNDRNGNFYEETPKDNAVSSLNIYFREELPYDIYNKIQQENLNKVKNG